jgi:CBS domain-containing protein
MGLLAVTDIAKVPSADWGSVTAGDLARTDLKPAKPTDMLSDVAARIRESKGEAVAVTEANTVIGVVTLRDLTNIEILLDRLENETT